MERFSRFIIRYRLPILILILVLTGFFIYSMRGLGFKTVLESTLPPHHPYVQIHLKFQEMFGGASTMLIAMESKKGDIFYKEFLKKFEFLTDEIRFHPDAITSQVISITRKKVKNIRGTAGGMDIRAFFEKGAPQTEGEIASLKENIFSNESIRGNLVSATGNAALIIANFKEDIDYKKLFDFFQKLKSRLEDEDIKIYTSGRPPLLGWIYHNNPRSVVIFIVSILAELILMALCLKQFHPLFIPLPILLALLNAVWGLGVMGVAKFNLDPLGMVIPFIIGAMVISHSVQMISRYGEHYLQLKDKKDASVAVIQSMFPPAFASIVTDAAGLFVLCAIPLPLIQGLGWIAGLWLLSAILGVSVLAPILFSYFPPPYSVVLYKDMLGKTSEKAASWLMGERRRRSVGLVLGVWIIILAGSLVLSQQVKVGDAHPGSSLLWPDSTYNKDDGRLNHLFPGTNPLYVVLQGKERDALKEPKVLRAVEAFERDISNCEGSGGTETLVAIVKKLNREFHEGDPKWSMLPSVKEEIAFYLWMFESKSDPGDLDRWCDVPYQHGNIICYFKDHKGDTIRQVIDRARQFLSRYPIPKEKVEFRLAGGIMGVTAAMDEVVGKYSVLTLWMALGVIFICCAVPYRSVLRGIILIASLITANYAALAYMGITKTGMTINALPVSAIGAGLGVDYGIYMITRIRDEIKMGFDLEMAIQRALSTTGRAVVITALTVILGIIFWYFSAIRFQAEMGFMIAFLLFVNMFGALFLVPSLTYLFRPGFLLKTQKEGGKS